MTENQVNDFLNECESASHAHIFDNSSTEIVNIFGGWKIVLTLCLTHPDTDTSQKLGSLRHLLQQNNNGRVNNTHKAKINIGSKGNHSERIEEKIKSDANDSMQMMANSKKEEKKNDKKIIGVQLTDYNESNDEKTDVSLSIVRRKILQPELDQTEIKWENYNNENINHFQLAKIVFQSETSDALAQECNEPSAPISIKAYRKSETIVNVDVQKNLYFVLFDDEFARRMVNVLVMKKWYTRLMLVLIGLFVSLHVICSTIGNSGKFETAVSNNKDIIKLMLVSAEVFSCIGFIAAIVLSMSWFFHINYEICRLVLHTFDFWFKLYNLILYNMATFVLFSSRYFFLHACCMCCFLVRLKMQASIC